MHSRFYYVYILTNRSKTLYTGVTSDLENRVFEHKNGRTPGFASRYKIDRLVYFERFGDVVAAIAREKQIKGLVRIKKMALIVSTKSRVEGFERRVVYQASISAGKYIDPSSGDLAMRGLHFVRMTAGVIERASRASKAAVHATKYLVDL